MNTGSVALARLTSVVGDLAEARTLDDLTAVRSIARGLEEYARAERLGDEAERYAREIQVRAARKAGEILLEMARNGSRRTQQTARLKSSSPRQLDSLSDLQITKAESHRWQAIASIPQADFDKYVAEGWSETAIAHRKPGRRSSKPPTPKPPKAKTNGYTRDQSLRGLQAAAVQLQGLAEALDAQLLGDWSRLYDDPAAQVWFDILRDSLPLVNARLKRIQRERGASSGADAAGVG